jgi:hypothetical protein
MTLEKLNSSLFKPLNASEAMMVLGGLEAADLAPAAGFTYLGRTQRKDGVIDNDYAED